MTEKAPRSHFSCRKAKPSRLELDLNATLMFLHFFVCLSPGTKAVVQPHYVRGRSWRGCPFQPAPNSELKKIFVTFFDRDQTANKRRILWLFRRL